MVLPPAFLLSSNDNGGDAVDVKGVTVACWVYRASVGTSRPWHCWLRDRSFIFTVLVMLQLLAAGGVGPEPVRAGVHRRVGSVTYLPY